MRREWLELHSEETCSVCKGATKVQHPLWAKFWAEPNAREMFTDEERLIAYFQKETLGYVPEFRMAHDPDFIPVEEEWCGNCEGQGVIRGIERVSLEDLAARLRSLETTAEAG